MRLFEDEPRDLHKLQAAHEAERAQLYAQIGRLTTQLVWLKKRWASTRTRSERVAMLDWSSAELTVKAQAELLGLNRTSLY